MRNILLQQVLKAVSRSFYLSIRFLPHPIHEIVAYAYLLCRAADTISDTPLLPEQNRLQALRDFEVVLTAFPLDPAEVTEFQERLSKEMQTHEGPEALLMKRLPVVAREVSNLRRTDQALIQKVVQGVIRGMMMDLKHFGTNSKDLKAFKSQEDLDSYLLQIGGQPGLFWSNVWLEHEKAIVLHDRAQWILQGVELGKGLQMINILRDLPRDLQNGRCYIPEEKLNEANLKTSDLLDQAKTSTFIPLYHHLIDETLTLLDRGMNYLDALPRFAIRHKLSVWLPIAVGLETLVRLRESEEILNPNVVTKIPRKIVYGIFLAAPFVVAGRKMRRSIFKRKADAASSKMD